MTTENVDQAKSDQTPREFFIMFLAMATILVGFVAGQWFATFSASGYIGTLERMTEHYRAKFDYYFKGANKRGYIELCRDASGEIDVLYRDECAE